MTSDQKITFRDIQTQDEQFLRLVYRSTREDELAVVPWTDAQKDHFLRFQFDAQHADYIKNYPNAQFLIIEADGAGIGRLYVDRTESEIRSQSDRRPRSPWRRPDRVDREAEALVRRRRGRRRVRLQLRAGPARVSPR